MTSQAKEPEAEEQIEKIFAEGAGVDVVFNIDTSQPTVRASLIYACDHKSRQVVIFQTKPKIFPSFKYKSMDIATLIHKELMKNIRVAVNCKIVRFIHGQKIQQTGKEDLIVVEYCLPLKKINLRSAFRLPTSNEYQVEGKILHGNHTYFSGKDFLVENISITGIGLIVPHKVANEKNPFMNIQIGETARAELFLKEHHPTGDGAPVSIGFEVRRKVNFHTRTDGFIGARFSEISSDDEDVLSQFIHKAQMYDIRMGKR